MVAHGCPKRKKLICGPEGEIVVAHDLLLSRALWCSFFSTLLLDLKIWTTEKDNFVCSVIIGSSVMELIFPGLIIFGTFQRGWYFWYVATQYTHLTNTISY